MLQRAADRSPPSRCAGPTSLRRAVGTRGFAGEVQAVLSRAREKGLDGAELRELGEAARRAGVRRGRPLPGPVPHRPRPLGAIDYADLIRRAVQRRRGAPRRAARAAIARVRRRVPGHRPRPGGPPARAGRRRPRPHRGRRPPPVDLRLPRRRRPRHPRLPDRLRARRTGLPADVVVLGTHPTVRGPPPAGAQRVAVAAAAAGRPRRGDAAPVPAARGRPSSRRPDSARCSPSTPSGPSSSTSADLLRRAHLEDGVAWSEMAVLVRSGRASIPPLRRALAAAGVPVEVAADDTPLSRAGRPHARRRARRRPAPRRTDPQQPGYVDAARAQGLASVTAGAGSTPADVRVLGRLLRRRGQGRGGGKRPSAAELAGAAP